MSGLRKRFEEIVDRHYEGLWGYVSFLTAASAEGEDIVHEAFLVAFDRLAAGREFEGDVGKWLRGAARNLVYAWWRDKRKMPQDVADRLRLMAEESEDALTTMSKAEVRAALARCLEQLPEEDRLLVARRYEEGRRVTDIAEELRKNVATVRVRLFRIRQSLKLCVEAQLAGGSPT